MIEDIVNNKVCFGCGACEQTCAVKAIEMIPDSEGFLVPEVNEALCIKCGACRKVCQAIHRKDANEVENGVHLIVQNHDYWNTKKSASGGAFIGIANYILKQGGVAFGAAMTEGCKVKHVKAENIAELRAMQSSKYVQSDIGHTYKEVARYLKQERYVLFSGTPCQVSGLYSYLKSDSSYLVTIDIICHGVPSPLLFHSYISYVQKLHGSRLRNIRFRKKNPIFKSRSMYFFCGRLKNGKSIVQRPIQNPYFNIFLKGFAFRETCYGCSYANINRMGDFTIGDCDSSQHYPYFHPNESNSVLMLNSKKAQALWESGISLCFDYSPLDIKLEASHNKQLSAPFPRPDERDETYVDLKQLDFSAFCGKYSQRQSLLSKIKVLLIIYLPPVVFRLKSKLKKHFYIESN